MQVLELEKIIIVGDKILVRPSNAGEKTSSGLYLPPGVDERDKVQSGYALKVGPGYAVGTSSEDEPWKESTQAARYIPLQIREGDYLIFLKKEAIHIEFRGEKLVIVPQSAVLLVYREDFLVAE